MVVLTRKRVEKYHFKHNTILFFSFVAFEGHSAVECI
jgi:hypothetical protein